MQYLGDVLLATPLIHSLKRAYPNSRIDVLVYSNTVAMLEGNADINTIIATPSRPKLVDYWQLLPKILRRYDLAMALQTGDRPFLYSLLAAPFRVSVVPPRSKTGWWKRYFVQRWFELQGSELHTVLQHLRLIDLLQLGKSFSLIPPQIADGSSLVQRFNFLKPGVTYAILHLHPQWIYKRWPKQGWLEIGNYLHDLGYQLVLSGGPAKGEMTYIAEIASALPKDTVNLAGLVSLAELTTIITKAKLFVGPDTGITHLAAATGIAVVALYGPTNPIMWAPWPKDYNQDVNPFRKSGSQQVNNIFLCQGQGDCVPCQLEGCDRHRHSRSQCLDSLTPKRVKEIIDKALRYSDEKS